MIKVKIGSKFIYDFESVAESWLSEVEWGTTPQEAVSTIAKMNDAKRIKSGKGFYIEIELTLEEAKFLKGEALYRYELNGTNEYDVIDKDYGAARSAKKIYEALESAGI